MRKILLLTTIMLLSCAGNITTSSDIMGDMPRYLGVAVFDGSYPYSNQASSQFANGLVEMGFLVIEQIHLPQIINEQKRQHSGMVGSQSGHVHPFNTNCVDLQCKSGAIAEVGRMYGVSGLFVGSVQTVFTSHYLDTYLNIRLIDVETGKTLWSVNAKEPRYFTLTYDLSTSVYHTTKQALSHFKEDIRRAK